MSNQEGLKRLLVSGEGKEIARQLVVTISEAVAQAAGSAATALDDAKENESNLENLVLGLLGEEPQSGVRLRKLVAESQSAVKPTQVEFTQAINALIEQGLALRTLSGEREAFVITAAGKSELTQTARRAHTSKSQKHREGIDVLRSGQRLAGVVLEVASNATTEQKVRAAQELELTRSRLLKILADQELD